MTEGTINICTYKHQDNENGSCDQVNKREHQDDAIKPKMPKNFSWVVDNRLSGMGFPDEDCHLLYLILNGVTCIITLTEGRIPCIDKYPEIEVLSLKVQDFTPPTMDQIRECLVFIDECNARGKAVGVHCAHGKGRTGTVIACYLVKTFGMEAEEAIERLREMRPGSVETNEQEERVVEFAKYLTAIQVTS